jgi:hypothetical protein
MVGLEFCVILVRKLKTMATRQELIEICKELKIYYEDLDTESMKDEIRQAFDKKYEKVKYNISPKYLSNTLLKFITLEYDWKLVDRDGNEVSYKEVQR